MAKKRELAGQEFGRLLVLYDTSERKDRKIVWHCRCDCGNEVDVIGRSLTAGHTKSCGCLQRQRAAEANTTHGMNRQGERHSIYGVWATMLQRCENPNVSAYRNYGGRGITVCNEWHDPQVFIEWALSNGWQKGLSIDRIDNDAGYSPDNCRWVTRKVQARNMRSNHLITFNGKTQTMVEWADELDISYGALESRINKLHWPIEHALSV